MKYLTLKLVFLFCAFSCSAARAGIVAETIAAEACGEGDRGMLAVAHVINNRVIARNQSAIRVVTAKNQFYGATAKNRLKLYKECQHTADKLESAINNGTLGVDVTKGAIYFRQPKEPVFSWHGEKTLTIGNHIFHKERAKK